MSVVSNLDNETEHGVKYESIDPMELLEKCGEVFLERQLGNLIYLCTLCDDKFKDVEIFSKHISEMHLSIESFISYEPNESEDDHSEEIDPIEETIKEELDEQEQNHSVSDESLVNNEEIFNIIDSTKTVLDIQIYVDERQLDNEIKEEEEKVVVAEDVEPQATATVSPDNSNHMEEIAADPSDEEILRSKLKCKYCGEQFDYVKQLRQHDCGLKKGRKLHYCSVCSKVFKKKSGLDIHMLIHKGEKPHKCEICGSAYACKQNLIVHIRRHTGEKPFKCNFCDRRFASSTEKISHMRTHTGERPFVCELCGKAHTSSSQLTEHMHRHLDIRNYVCELCDKRFRNSYNLRMHRLTHEDVPRKFNCDHCMSAFKTQNNLLQHMKIHQKVKKYVCKICGRAFAQHPGLYSHMKSHAISK